ncbi:hypothetical protein BS17DRAFT_787852 [Gyrodon lividus]|nr:hypothetical protein BS17DRAFT_787852 [Gyrodon lividus]
MTPASIPSHLVVGEPFAYARKADAFQARAVLDTRSTVDTGNNNSNTELQKSTTVLIVAGVVCFFILLVGFWLVARPRVSSNVATNVPVPYSAADTHAARTRRGPDMSERWGIWKIFPHTTFPSTPASRSRANGRASHGFSTLATHYNTPHILPTTPSRIIPADSAIPNVVSRHCAVRPDSQPCGPTERSANTLSLAHSHITEDTLNDFHASAYDLDTDLEQGMLKNLQGDVSHHRAVEDGCVSMSMEGAVELEGTATHAVGGGVVTSAGVWSEEGSDRGLDTHVRGDTGPGGSVMTGSAGIEVDVIAVDKVAMGRQALL